MDEQARVAVRITGADHTSWNRVWDVLDPDDRRWGLACRDNSLRYHPEHIVESLRDMFNRAGQQQGDWTLQRYKEAIRIILHENIHLLAARGTSHSTGFDAYKEPAHEVVEEATTELATQILLDRYIAELDLERIAPGISDVSTPPPYGEYRPAVERFANAVGARVDMSGDEVILRMAVVNAEDKFRVVAELLYDRTLSEVVPEQARAGAVAEIEAAMKPAFASIHGYDPNDPLDVKMSALAGLEAFQQANTKIHDIAEYWSSNQDLRRSLDAGLGATPPLQTTHGPTPAPKAPPSSATSAPTRRTPNHTQPHREPPTSRGD
ncbi:hypothetical protein OHA10_10780 [Kribbella sp. NBC_00662]|uniref:hypothetical protein n=1 Tax=Kribbella sp. NBC_00662 TaxID=2975969 RepID=UPI003249E2DA